MTPSVREDVDIEGIQISIASPEEILSWSHGEVLKPETINYRTQKPERDGLFCEKIFGPVKDYECYCGKYRKIRYKGVVCDRCGVEVTKSIVRRERMGHINLAVPVAHIWYLRNVPSFLSIVLDIPMRDLERVVYFGSYIVLSVNEEVREKVLSNLEKEYQKSKGDEEAESSLEAQIAELKQLKPLDIIPDLKYQELSLKYGQIVKVGIGAAAIREILCKMDLGAEIEKIKKEIHKGEQIQNKKLLKRLRVLSSLERAKIRPEWMILTVLPVIPPGLRPMVQLDGGRFATSDLNDLYRRVINRNNRLKKLIAQGAPEVICRNEKRMLQEAVDALIDNQATRGKGVTTTSGKRRLRSLSDMLRGKQGRFRQNLLGKRVDYSGRSVIVVGPELALNQCGLPKVMALELFKPFVIAKLVQKGCVPNVKSAQRHIERETVMVWDALEEVAKDYYVFLNRAPTLHRLGIQAFLPVLIEGKAIAVHPLVCPAFNADFDGDQMAVHVPLLEQSKREAKELMSASTNLLKPASGDPVVTPSKDIVLGCFWLTLEEKGAKGEGKIFSTDREALLAYQLGFVDLRAPIKVRIDQGVIETTVGRIIFNQVLPPELGFINNVMGKKQISSLVARCFRTCGPQKTVELVDKIKDLGFYYATISGVTFSISDVLIPSKKQEILKHAEEKLALVYKQYQRGLITELERYEKAIEIWTEVKTQVEKEMLEGFYPHNPVYAMVVSGARGSVPQLTQIAGMKGLVVNPTGEIIELPIRSNFKEGFSMFEYFISTHGARKGRSDTALRTSDAGYLTRRLVDVAQDIVITEEDCGGEGICLTSEESQEMGLDFQDRIVGRFLAKDIPEVGLKRGDYLSEELARKIVQNGISHVWVRSPITCQTHFGVCQKCYGQDLARGGLVNLGEAVGIIAAQAIGEPGTQLTLRTFHIGGVVGEDITQGLPRVEELFEARPPRFSALISEIDGQVVLKEGKEMNIIEVVSSDIASETIDIKGYELLVKNGAIVDAKQAIASAPNKKAKRASISGKVEIKNHQVIIKAIHPLSKVYQVPKWINPVVAHHDFVRKGQPLTEGHLNLQQFFRLVGKEETARYIVREMFKIYTNQGQDINEKHIEIIVRKMFSKAKVLDPGESDYLSGQIVDIVDVNLQNEKMKKKIIVEPLVLGITKVALQTESFLSAASFQETTSVLLNAAVEGRVDPLRGLKENIIIGRLIPAGTGFRR